MISALPGITSDAIAGGISLYDESTLRRLHSLGWKTTWLADPRADLGVDSPLAGMESIQDRLTVATATRIAERHGRPDVLLVRYALPDPTPKKVREGVGRLLNAGLSAVQFDALRNELASAGLPWWARPRSRHFAASGADTPRRFFRPDSAKNPVASSAVPPLN